MSQPNITLMFHDVLDDGAAFSASGFSGAGADGYKIVRSRLEWMVAHPGARDITFTFDDGGVSTALVAAPILKSAGLEGRFLIATSRIGEPGFVDAGNLRDLVAAGHVVGSHSHTHPDRLSSLPYRQIVTEWQRSVEELADVVSAPIEVASIPNGFSSRRVIEAAAEAGIRRIYTSVPRSRPARLYGVDVVGRFTVRHSHGRARVEALLAGERRALLRQQAQWYGLSVPKRVLGPAYPLGHELAHRLLSTWARR